MTEPGCCVLGHVDPVEAFIGHACKRHYHHLGDTLREIETLFALRDDVILPGPGGDVRVSGGGYGSPAPGRLHLMAMTDARASLPDDLDDDDVPDVPGALLSYARRVQRAGRASETLNRHTVTACIRVLRRERKWIVAQVDWLPTYAEGITVVHRTLAAAVGDTMWPRPVGKCPNCTAPLFNTIGLDEIHCRRCKSTWTGVHLARLRLIHDQEAR